MGRGKGVRGGAKSLIPVMNQLYSDEFVGLITFVRIIYFSLLGSTGADWNVLFLVVGETLMQVLVLGCLPLRLRRVKQNMLKTLCG